MVLWTLCAPELELRPSVQKRQSPGRRNTSVTFGQTFIIDYKYTIFQRSSFVRLLVATLAPASITPTPTSSAVPTTVIIIISQVQPLSTIGLVVIIVVLFMVMAFIFVSSIVVAFGTMTTFLLPIVWIVATPATGRCVVIGFYPTIFTVTSSGGIGVTCRVGIARGISTLQRLTRRLV